MDLSPVCSQEPPAGQQMKLHPASAGNCHPPVGTLPAEASETSSRVNNLLRQQLRPGRSGS
jgi:hypothetical protein